ncbi:tRNA (guanosine(37)-N1)-methyltransferase TrmD [Burkholderiales bacterium]|nr:tRNA (guanosine(37)-N1)-methyltransferase TrmD [Burkholderiales bacterium]
MKRFDVVTLFPEMFSALTESGVTGRGGDRGIYDLVCWNPREFANDPRRTVDDRPYGGGAGMILMADPLAKAIDAGEKRQKGSGVRTSKTVYLSPQGRVLTQRLVEELSSLDGLVLLSGRYEGVDDRVIESRVDHEISIGDYVLSGGELAAMVLLDSIIRLLPGVVNHTDSVVDESHSSGTLEYPQYTRPEVFEGRRVPDVLLSGHHAQIKQWRSVQAQARTRLRRPDLLKNNKSDS